MKKIISILVLSLILYSCSQGEKNEKITSDSKEELIEKEYEVNTKEFKHELARPLGYTIIASTIRIKAGESFNFVNSDAEFILDKNKEYFSFGFSKEEKLAFILEKGKKTGAYINNQGEIAFDEVDGKKIYLGSLFDRGYSKVRLDEDERAPSITINKKGVISLDDSFIKKDKYRLAKIYNSENKYMYYQKKETETPMFGLYDIKTSKKLTPKNYSSLSFLKDNRILAVDKSNKNYIIDSEGKIVVDVHRAYPNAVVSNIEPGMKDTLSLYLEKENKSIVINLDGMKIFEKENMKISNINELGYATFEKDGKFGIIDKNANIIEAAKYDEISNLETDFVIAKKDDNLYLVKFKLKK